MSIATSLTQTGTKLAAAIDNCKTAIAAKGVTVPSGAVLNDLPGYIGQISGGKSAAVTVSNTYGQTVTGIAYLADGTSEVITFPEGTSAHTLTQNCFILFSPALYGQTDYDSGTSTGGMVEDVGGDAYMVLSVLDTGDAGNYASQTTLGVLITGLSAALEIAAFSYA